MSDSLNYVRETARLLGLKLPKEREAAVSESVEAALKQVAEIRRPITPNPSPSTFDASWGTKK